VPVAKRGIAKYNATESHPSTFSSFLLLMPNTPLTTIDKNKKGDVAQARSRPALARLSSPAECGEEPNRVWGIRALFPHVGAVAILVKVLRCYGCAAKLVSLEGGSKDMTHNPYYYH